METDFLLTEFQEIPIFVKNGVSLRIKTLLKVLHAAINNTQYICTLSGLAKLDSYYKAFLITDVKLSKGCLFR